MGIFAYHIGKMDIPEEHREEWARQMLELLRAGGMMTVETLQLYRKKIYLLSPPELDEEERATGYYNCAPLGRSCQGHRRCFVDFLPKSHRSSG